MLGVLVASASLYALELTTRCDPPEGSLERLSKNQQKMFLDLQKLFSAGNYDDALAGLRALLEQLPLNTPAKKAVAAMTAELALETGDRAYAISLLKPIEKQDGGDCSARTLLARAYAENGQPAERDAEIDALTALHKQAPESPAGKLDMFLLERHSLKNKGNLAIGYVLRPYSPHNTYLSAEIFDASGKQVLHIELDSDDGDQGFFKEEHPDRAAKGERRYSLDLFKVSNGEAVLQQHALIQFFEGKPKYDTVRERILAIAEHSEDAQSLLH